VNINDFGNVDLFYDRFYDSVLRTGCIGAVQNRTHRSMEKPFNSADTFENVLEVGAGDGAHLHFVKHKYLNYYETDIRIPRQVDDPTVKVCTTTNASRLVREFADVLDLHYGDNQFDRVIATCLMLHLEKPEVALSELRRVTKNGGVISLLVPCEPGLMLRISRKLLTSPKAKRVGFTGYDLFCARDHINYISSIDKLIHFVFRKDIILVSTLPFRWPSWNLNLYFIYLIHRGEND
jgi:ubiquinone/menaquinone biosynthesis C-methylase UbiE